jgi:hypothetical protein
MDQKLGVDSDAANLRELRNGAELRAVAAWKLTGARNGANGYAKISNNEVDIAKIAGTDQDGRSPGDSPYNNWLNTQSQPLFTFYAQHVGVYLGDGLAHGVAGAGNLLQAKKVIAEHSMLRIESTAMGVICKEPVWQLPPGVEFAGQQTDSAVYIESHGPMYPVGLLRLPKNTAFAEQKDVIKLALQFDKDLVTLLQSNAGGFAGSFPTAGAIIAVVFYGQAEFRVGARAS